MSYFYRKSMLIDQIIDDPSFVTQEDRDREKETEVPLQASSPHLSLSLSETRIELFSLIFFLSSNS